MVHGCMEQEFLVCRCTPHGMSAALPADNGYMVPTVTMCMVYDTGTFTMVEGEVEGNGALASLRQ